MSLCQIIYIAFYISLNPVFIWTKYDKWKTVHGLGTCKQIREGK